MPADRPPHPADPGQAHAPHLPAQHPDNGRPTDPGGTADRPAHRDDPGQAHTDAAPKADGPPYPAQKKLVPHLNYSEPVPVDHAPRNHDLSGYDPPGPGEHPRVPLEAIGPDTSGWEQVKRKVDDWTDDGNVLFRGDSRPPSEIAKSQGFGLKNPGGVVDIRRHVHGITNAYVSTSKSADIAAKFGAKSDGYVYRVKAPGGTLTEETQARAGDQGGTQYREREVLFPGGIHFSHIEGWHKTFADAHGNTYLGEFEPNPHYVGGAREDAPAHPKGLEQPDQGHVPPPVAPPKHVLERQERERAIAEGRDPDAPADPAPAADPTPDPGASERDHTPIGGRFDPSLLDPGGEPTGSEHSGDQHPGDQHTDGSHQYDSADTTAHQDPAEPPPTPARSISTALDGLEGPEDLARPGPPLTEPAVHSGVGDEQSRQAFLDEHFPGYGDINPHHADSGAADGYRTNCVEAMLADERRHHGEPAQAAPTRPEDVATDGRLSRVREALGGVWTSHRDFDAVTSAMAQTPEGSRGAVAFRHTDADGHAIGHVVRVVHTPDGVAFADPQTGRLAELPAGATDVRLLSADHTDDTAHTDVPDDGGYGRSPEEQREQAVDEVAAELGITDPRQRQALADTYDVAREYTAPIVVDVAARMHDDLVAKVTADPGHRVVFLGRDGHSLALATRALDPGFFDRHATEVVLSRAVVEAALRDTERADPDRDLSAVDAYRMHRKVDDADVPGARDRLNNYLGAAGVPVRGDNGISLVDTSYKGTVQEMLTALYPRPRFEGLYAFHGQDPSDPHPDAKKGYLVDLGPEDGAGKPLTELPADPARTFAHQDAIGVIEETLHGTMSSPRGIGPDGPVQQPQRFEADPTVGINPLRVAEPFTDPAVREGAKAMGLRAVVDVAEEAAARRAEGGPWRAELAARAEHGRDQVRSWVAGDDPDPRFREVMDSLVRRGDKGAVQDVEELTRDLDPQDRRRVWAEFDALPTVRERIEYAARMREGRS